jgi:hypothetical protein
MYDGRYQMGQAERAETARRLFAPVPTRGQFRADHAMQERFFEAYPAAHNDQLMHESAKYCAMSPTERLEVLAYAHNQGAVGPKPGSILDRSAGMRFTRRGRRTPMPSPRT